MSKEGGTVKHPFTLFHVFKQMNLFCFVKNPFISLNKANSRFSAVTTVLKSPLGRSLHPQHLPSSWRCFAPRTAAITHMHLIKTILAS